MQNIVKAALELYKDARKGKYPPGADAGISKRGGAED